MPLYVSTALLCLRFLTNVQNVESRQNDDCTVQWKFQLSETHCTEGDIKHPILKFKTFENFTVADSKVIQIVPRQALNQMPFTEGKHTERNRHRKKYLL